MRMKKFGISLLFTAMLLAGIMFVPVVNAQENTTKELTFGPETLNELKKAPDFIAAYGNTHFCNFGREKTVA